jgi:hypothetical protein
MNLDNILNKKLNKTLYKEIRHRKSTPLTKEQKTRANIKYVIRLIKTGDFDSTKYSHQIILSQAVKHGYVDRKTLTILKED